LHSAADIGNLCFVLEHVGDLALDVLIAPTSLTISAHASRLPLRVVM
jgi:hypothetical protein